MTEDEIPWLGLVHLRARDERGIEGGAKGAYVHVAAMARDALECEALIRADALVQDDRDEVGLVEIEELSTAEEWARERGPSEINDWLLDNLDERPIQWGPLYLYAADDA